ncbi:hypothetical protein AALO_G00212920 [Alosa alosa]|uniref:Retinoic acid receptor responder protein 2 n=1 Tax=Alosa alosa TaxID=278164 RepID=A0AAV6G084_9TELE|nr:hypothetical protein AALO_G00212920 [Alosa alosa]
MRSGRLSGNSSPESGGNMAYILTVLLLAAGVLGCTEAQQAYSKLPDLYRNGVDLALQQLNSHSAIKNHFLFFKSLDKSDIDIRFGVRFFYHNFYLKVTSCAKGTANADPTKCPFRNNRPLIDCVACYNTYFGKIEPEPKPYIHCVHKPFFNQEVQTKRRIHCDGMNHMSGGGTLLAQKSP